MRVFFHPDQLRHDPRFFLMRGKVRRCFEVPARAAALCEGVAAAGLAVASPPPLSPEALACVHDPGYLAFLQEGWRTWSEDPNAGPEIVPNMHPTPEMIAQGARPGHGIVAQAGWYMADTACAIGASTWVSVIAAAACAHAAAAEVAGGAGAAYALCRPPGHHAYAARAGGHCYINNSALAAERLLAAGAARIAVIDIDSHHGNGTQGIFWLRPDILTASVHGDPNHYYPWFVGHAGERGGEGAEGANVNLPLPRGAGDDVWLDAIAEACRAARAHGAEAIVVALGFDASGEEPLGFLAVSDDGFARAGETISSLRLPTVIVQEGGYALDALPRLVGRFLAGFGT